MAKRDKTYMPMGTGGLLRFQEEEKQLIKIKPKNLIYIVIAITVVEIMLRVLFPLF